MPNREPETVAEIGAQLLRRVDELAKDVHEVKTSVAVMASKFEIVEEVASGLRDHEVRLTKAETWIKVGVAIASSAGGLLMAWFVGQITGLL